jgi:hypothetical protein
VEGDGTDRIKEAVRRKNFMWWEWFKERMEKREMVKTEQRS